MKSTVTRSALAALAACVCGLALPLDALACSSCGCTLNADWASQGFKRNGGFSIDLRHDDFNQTDLRTGTGRVDRSAISFPAGAEIQQQTVNRNSTPTLDYGINADWGASLQLPTSTDTTRPSSTATRKSRPRTPAAWGTCACSAATRAFRPSTTGASSSA